MYSKNKIYNATLKKAFLLQFEGDEFDINHKFGLDPFSYYGRPINTIMLTGLFGILDALIDLGLTNREIMDFYVHGHVEPYNDPYGFTEGIIDIVHGMSKLEIKNKYRDYFTDERIANFTSSFNTQMLLSFCYGSDDTYVFIPDKDDLYDRFAENYNSIHDDFDNYKKEHGFQKIDGKLFRVVRFMVRNGFDFPELESLFNEQIDDIIFKQTDGENTFILNKKYACEMSNDLLSIVCFLKKYEYSFINPQSLFNPYCESIVLLDSSGKQIVLKRSYLESDVTKYNDILLDLKISNIKVPNIISLCDKREENIELIHIDNDGLEHSLSVKHDLFISISQELLRVINISFNLGFTFPDIYNLFDINEEFLKIIDPNGVEHLVVRKQFANLLEIITSCKQSNFSVNYNQLFNPSCSNIELIDGQAKKAYINRDRIIHMMTTFSLLSEYGYSFNDYSNLFDESQPYIISYDENGQKRFLSRKQINKIIKVKELSAEKNKDLSDSEKDLLFMIKNDSMRKKLFEWLPYTAKKWIPSSAVINKIPAEQSHEYFYNNNHVRLKLLKDEYHPSNYEEMEGIVSIGYILGLFDSKESTSEKALNYIIDHFLKKGISANELHTTYGAIDLRRGYNKKFADFFMQHYAVDSVAFVEPDLLTNMTGELFERFDEVLENRPEKKIKTNTKNKLLTPKDAMASIIDTSVDREMLGEKAYDERYINLVKLLKKFGAGKDELLWAIELYEQALAIDEQKVSIPHIEDLETSLMKFISHLKSDPHAFNSGRKTNCCSRYGGNAHDRLTHVITDPNWRYVTFISPNRTFFDGLVWYDKEEQVVCIDNVEGQFSKIDEHNKSSIPMMADTIIRYADGIYRKMNELRIPCRKINVGKDSGTASWEIFKYASQQNLIYDDENPCNYPVINNISTDANYQFTITDEKLLSLRGKTLNNR